MEADERQTCPRRMSEYGPWQREEGQDTWTTGHGVIGQDRVGLSCSFCGSLHPDRFMELVREGWTVGPTDKNYKAYLGRPHTDEEKTQRKAQWLAGFNGSTEETTQLAGLYDREHAFPTCSQEAKFYFQHLSEDQCREFIDLHNSHQMTVGAPGHFYSRPFFCGPPA
jgi:hypothetical protein